MPQAPVYADVTVTDLPVSVTSAAGGAGQTVAITTPTVGAELKNGLDGPIEYQVGAAGWLFLDTGAGVLLPINLAYTTLKLRKAASTRSVAFGAVVSYSAGTALKTRNGSVFSNVIVSSVAPSNGDGEPDGTIYIQTA